MQQKGKVPFFLLSKYIGFGCDHYYYCYIMSTTSLLLQLILFLYPFWNHRWSLQSDWLSLVRFFSSHYFLFEIAFFSQSMRQLYRVLNVYHKANFPLPKIHPGWNRNKENRFFFATHNLLWRFLNLTLS